MGSLYIGTHWLWRWIAPGRQPWRLIAPTGTGPQPYNPGGEVAMWTSRNRGRTWTQEKAMTRDSEYNHTYVRRTLNAHPDFWAYWADGHARRPSESRLYFADKAGRVFRLPFTMTREFEKPEQIR